MRQLGACEGREGRERGEGRRAEGGTEQEKVKKRKGSHRVGG
jgi:hypothetical protein